MTESGIFFNSSRKSLLNGELVRALIRRKKLRQYQVAKRIRVSPATLTQILNRKYMADSALIVSMAQVLGVNPSILVSNPVTFPFLEARNAS